MNKNITPRALFVAVAVTALAAVSLGPAAQAMERKDGRYRAQLIFRSPQRAPLHQLVNRTLLAVRSFGEAGKVRWSIDIDPLEI